VAIAVIATFMFVAA